MKIVTNIQSSQLGGITQAIALLLAHLHKHDRRDIQFVGLELQHSSTETRIIKTQKKQLTALTILSNLPGVGQVAEESADLNQMRLRYHIQTTLLTKILKRERPDILLLNGTYFVPWLLLEAARDLKIPTVVHYHGILSKETEHWSPHPRMMMQLMERSFDNPNFLYIFPSDLAKRTVENEVFLHGLEHAVTLPNSIPDHFFAIKPKGGAVRVGAISRWTKIKNPDFFVKLAQHNHTHGSKYKLHMVTDVKRYSTGWNKLRGLAEIHRPVHNSRLGEFYSRLAVVISPSHFETYGNVAQEAIASGTPALVSTNMGVAEIFHKVGLGDLVIPFDSVSKVYKKIGEAAKERITDKTRIQMQEILSPESVNSELLKIISGV